MIRLTSISSPFPESQRSGSELSNPLITKLVLQTTTAVLKVKVKSLSCVRLFVTPWTVAYQTPLSTEFSRQEYWSGLPFPSSGDLPNPGIKPASPVSAGRFSTTELNADVKYSWYIKENQQLFAVLSVKR